MSRRLCTASLIPLADQSPLNIVVRDGLVESAMTAAEIDSVWQPNAGDGLHKKTVWFELYNCLY